MAFELISEGPVGRSDLVKEIMSSASSLLGDVMKTGKVLSSAPITE